VAESSSSGVVGRAVEVVIGSPTIPVAPPSLTELLM
jgi:hypothetical protein